MFYIFLFCSFIHSYDQPVTTDVIKKGLDDSQFYRIPAIAFVPDNKTLVAAADKRWKSIYDLPEKIDVVIKISKDNGVTWSKSILLTPGKKDNIGYGDPALIVDHQKKSVYCLFSGNKGTFGSTKDDRQRNYYCVSHDNGETWSDMVDFTDSIYGTGCLDEIRSQFYSNFLTSGNGLQMRNGRMMLVGVTRRSSGTGLATHAVYSDNHGKTWTMSSSYGTNNGDESKVVELNNGSVLMSIRRRPNRVFTVSNDGGETWGKNVVMSDLKDPACNGDLIRYTSTKDGFNKNRLIHTMLYMTDGSATRMNLTILISYDEGETWPVKKVIEPSYAIYSSVTFSPTDGTIYVFWEKSIDSTVAAGCDLVLTKMSLEWVTDGADKWEPPSN